MWRHGQHLGLQASGRILVISQTIANPPGCDKAGDGTTSKELVNFKSSGELIVAMKSERLYLWIGESSPPVFKRYRRVMDSAINYYKQKEPRTPYSYKELFLDSGAFTIARRGLNIDKEIIKRTQEKLDPDKAIPIDYPFLPGMSVREMEKRWKMTAANILEWQETTKLQEVVPVIHAWSMRSLVENIEWVAKHADSELIAIGTLVTSHFTDYRGFFGDRQLSILNLYLIITAIQIIKHRAGLKVHLMGFGASPITLHMAYYMGADSVDTTGYRRKAIYGKIVLPGRGERYVGHGGARFGVKKLTDEDIRLLASCGCPICRQDWALLRGDWRLRVIHNRYVLEREAALANELISRNDGSYERYLDQIYSRSSTIVRGCWKFLKRRARQLTLYVFL